MKLVTFVQSSAHLEQAVATGVHEVLLEHADLATLGTLSNTEIETLAEQAVLAGCRPVLVWDRLMSDSEIDSAIAVLGSLRLDLFSAIRVQDPGALEFLLQDSKNIPIQLILRTGSHNFESIRLWTQYARPRLERVVLSVELPRSRLQEYARELRSTFNVDVEVLGFGPIQLFHSPRKLLSPRRAEAVLGSQALQSLSAIADCDENTHKGFRLHETQHGTVMFHSKEYCLLDRVEDLAAIGVSAFRVDLRLEPSAVALAEIGALFVNFDTARYELFLTNYSHKVTRCFYQANATDVLFKKLKNYSTQRTDAMNANYIGDVIESKSKEHLIIYVQGSREGLNVGRRLAFVTPKGGRVEYELNELRNLQGEVVQSVPAQEYAVIPYVRTAAPTTGVYYV